MGTSDWSVNDIHLACTAAVTWRFPESEIAETVLSFHHPASMVRNDFSYESARLRALVDLAKIVAIPSLVLTSLLGVTKIQLGYYTIPCYGFFVFLGSYFQGLYNNFQLERDAERLASRGKGSPVGSIPVQVSCDYSFCNHNLFKHCAV